MKVYAVVWEDYEEHHIHEGKVYVDKTDAVSIMTKLNEEIIQSPTVQLIRAKHNPNYTPTGCYELEEYEVVK